MTVRTGNLLVAFMLLGAGRGAAQSPDARAMVRKLSGCWTVTLGAYAPAMDLGADSGYSRPPKRIDLDSVRGSRLASYGWTIRPSLGIPTSIDESSYFNPIGADSVLLIWTTGFSGLKIRAAIGNDTLRGVATPFWDFPRAAQHAQVVLVRGCDSAIAK